MRKLMTAILTMSILFIGCSKKAENFKIDEQNGIKVYSNTEIPNDPNAKLDLKKLFTVSSEAQTDSNACMKRPVSLTADKLDNIYILDVMSMSVKKFDSSGNFIKSIGRMGQGPGELFYPSIMFIDNDTLNLMSAGSRKISKFDLDGNFYSDKLITDQTQLQNTKISRDGQKIVSYVVKPIMKEGQQPDIDFALSVLEMGNLKEKSVLNSKILSVQDLMAGKIDFNDLVIPFIPGNDYVYISENSDNQYRILGYDYNGKKQIEIRKDFKMIRYENAEKEEYITEMKKMMQGTKELKVGNFKKAIVAIHTDKYGRLLVYPNVDRNEDKDGVYLDIFKDGKFLNRINYEIQDKANIGILGMFKKQEFFIGDRLYILNGEELTLDVYNY
ncbi:MAG: 6-bladed beta-propeller [Candidatus Delongbacteria bacterium]|nr:6-bladed beta-propeller [Candidatus Delongbacteria bacterium]